MRYINTTTGKTAPAHQIGTTEDGQILYHAEEGWEPDCPYECDEDGNWLVSELPAEGE